MELEYNSRKNRANQMKREQVFFSVSHFAIPLPTVTCNLSPVTWTHTFSAKEKDTETGLSYFGSRYYSSDLSIWLSEDPMSDSIPYMTPYNYCKNPPIVMKDPNGEFPIETIWDIANVVYDVGAAVVNHIKGDHAQAKGHWVDAGADAIAMFIPYVPAGTTKAIGFTFKGFKALDKISAGGKTYSRLADFEKSIHNLSPGERVTRIRELGEQVAKHNDWGKNTKLSKINHRNIYTDKKTGTHFSIDTQHGEFDYYDGISEREAFILAKCYEEDCIFQIIQITGLHSGYLLGYVKYGILCNSWDTVTYDELIESIKFNFIGPDLDTLIILDNPLELANLDLINSTHQQV